MKLILRTREQNIGGQRLVTLWLMRQHTQARSGLMHGDLRPDDAEALVAFFERAGVTIERDPVQHWSKGSELPRGTVEAEIAATAEQGVMF